VWYSAYLEQLVVNRPVKTPPLSPYETRGFHIDQLHPDFCYMRWFCWSLFRILRVLQTPFLVFCMWLVKRNGEWRIVSFCTEVMQLALLKPCSYNGPPCRAATSSSSHVLSNLHTYDLRSTLVFTICLLLDKVQVRNSRAEFCHFTRYFFFAEKWIQFFSPAHRAKCPASSDVLVSVVQSI
jgi:hypothetical protein